VGEAYFSPCEFCSDFASELLRVILPIIEDPSISIDKKEESLDDFIAVSSSNSNPWPFVQKIQGLNGYEGEEGKENAERLQHLKRNLYAFSQDLVQSGTSQRPDVQDRIKTLDEEIAQIQEDLERSVCNFPIFFGESSQ